MTLILFGCFIKLLRPSGVRWFSGRMEYGEFYGRYINLPFVTLFYGRHIPIRFTAKQLNAIERIVSELI